MNLLHESEKDQSYRISKTITKMKQSDGTATVLIYSVEYCKLDVCEKRSGISDNLTAQGVDGRKFEKYPLCADIWLLGTGHA